MRHLVITALLLLLSCAHAEKTRSQEGKGATGAEKGSSKDGAKEKRNNQTPLASEAITTSKTTDAMFKEEGIKKLQHALVQKGADNAPDGGTNKNGSGGLEESGKLDAKTQEALRAFQKSQKLPDSGLPDYETIRRLGVKPEDVYQHAPPSQRVGVP